MFSQILIPLVDVLVMRNFLLGQDFGWNSPKHSLLTSKSLFYLHLGCCLGIHSDNRTSGKPVSDSDCHLVIAGTAEHHSVPPGLISSSMKEKANARFHKWFWRKMWSVIDEASQFGCMFIFKICGQSPHLTKRVGELALALTWGWWFQWPGQISLSTI